MKQMLLIVILLFACRSIRSDETSIVGTVSSENNQSTPSLINKNLVLMIKDDNNHQHVHMTQLKINQNSFPLQFTVPNINEDVKHSGTYFLTLFIYGLPHKLLWESILFRQHLVVNSPNHLSFVVKDVSNAPKCLLSGYLCLNVSTILDPSIAVCCSQMSCEHSKMNLSTCNGGAPVIENLVVTYTLSRGIIPSKESVDPYFVAVTEKLFQTILEAETVIKVTNASFILGSNRQYHLRLHLSLITSESCNTCLTTSKQSIEKHPMPFKIRFHDGSSQIVLLEQPVINSTDINKLVTKSNVPSTSATLTTGANTTDTTTTTSSNSQTTEAFTTHLHDETTSATSANMLTDRKNSDATENVCGVGFRSYCVGTDKAEPTIRLKNPIPIANGVSNGSLDDVVFHVTLPMNVTLYSTSTNQVSISTNGVLCLGSCSDQWYELMIPVFNSPSDTVFAYWTDLVINPGTLQGIYYAIEGNVSSRNITFEYLTTMYDIPSAYCHFQVKFFEAKPGIVDVIYFEVPYLAQSVTVGVQELHSASSETYMRNDQYSVWPNLILTFNTKDNVYNTSLCGSTQCPEEQTCVNEVCIEMDEIGFTAQWSRGNGTGFMMIYSVSRDSIYYKNSTGNTSDHLRHQDDHMNNTSRLENIYATVSSEDRKYYICFNTDSLFANGDTSPVTVTVTVDVRRSYRALKTMTRTFFASTSDTTTCDTTTDNYIGLYKGCLYGKDEVTLVDGRKRLVEELRHGDKVWSISPDGESLIEDEVYIMIHNEPNQSLVFYTIKLINGYAVSLTGDHYIPIYDSSLNETRILPASEVREDHYLIMFNEKAAIAMITTNTMSGYYAPITLSGYIMVNNISVSCFPQIYDLSHEKIQFKLRFLRAYYRLKCWLHGNDYDPYETNVKEGPHPLLVFIDKYLHQIRLINRTIDSNILPTLVVIFLLNTISSSFIH